MLNRYGSGMMLIIAGGAYVVRVIGYSLIPQGQTTLVLLLEPLHGVTYACSKTSGVEFVADLMPVGYEASGQGLLGLFGGFGAVTGLFVGGLTEELLGPRIMYRLIATIVFLGMAVFSIASWQGKPTFQRLDMIPSRDVELSQQCKTREVTFRRPDTLETWNDNAK